MIYNSMLEQLPYRTPLQPYATYFMLFLVTLLTITNGFYVFVPSEWNVADFLAAYITIPIFVALYFGHKIYFATAQMWRGENVTGHEKSGSFFARWYSGVIWATPTPEIDVITGKREMDELESLDQPPVPRNIFEKIWFWIA